MRERGDYSRVEEYLHEIQDEIEYEWGEKYEELPKDVQIQALLDHFFKGIPNYWGSAADMREGIKFGRVAGEFTVKVGYIYRRGKSYRIIRDSQTGRIRQWVRD